MKEYQLVTETQKLLNRSPLPLRTIADETGVSKRWLGYLRAGDIDPVYSKLVTVHRYLKQSKAKK